jgi:hypothetical protein
MAPTCKGEDGTANFSFESPVVAKMLIDPNQYQNQNFSATAMDVLPGVCKGSIDLKTTQFDMDDSNSTSYSGEAENTATGEKVFYIVCISTGGLLDKLFFFSAQLKLEDVRSQNFLQVVGDPVEFATGKALIRATLFPLGEKVMPENITYYKGANGTFGLREASTEISSVTMGDSNVGLTVDTSVQ